MSIYKGDTLLVGNIPNSANKDLSNLSNTGQAVLDNKTDIDMSNLSTAGKITMANLAMPSETYTQLTLQTSGSSYTAPADGYIHITLQFSADGYVYVKQIYSTAPSGQRASVFCPVVKGEKFRIDYTNKASTPRFRFYYAVGTESEAS